MQNTQNLTPGSAKLNSLLNKAIDLDYCGTVVVDNKGVITFSNKSFAEIMEKRPEEMVGRHIHDTYVNSVPSRLPNVLGSGSAEIGDTHFMNGRHMVVDRSPIYIDGKVVGALGKVIYRNIQELNNLYNKINRGIINLGKPNAHPSVKYDLQHITGKSQQILKLKNAIARIALHNSTVLIRGECGTGKELFAQAIHSTSLRRNNPFVKVNCAAIPEHLLESELFGYEEGAFTGAKKGGKKGKFELADKGTIFLDEIGDMSFNMQAKLLRVLQEKEIEPLGGSRTKEVDVRVIAATNANLEELMKMGKFRHDLFYRLNVVTLDIPPLRDRKEDIDLLVDHFTSKFNENFSLKIEKVSPEVIEVFKNYDWPGNVRELANIMEQAFNFVESNIITLDDISRYLLPYIVKVEQGDLEETALTYGHLTLPASGENRGSLVEIMDFAEKKMIMKALVDSNGNKAKAAKMLGLSRPGLYKKLAKYKIET